MRAPHPAKLTYHYRMGDYFQARGDGVHADPVSKPRLAALAEFHLAELKAAAHERRTFDHDYHFRLHREARLAIAEGARVGIAERRAA